MDHSRVPHGFHSRSTPSLTYATNDPASSGHGSTRGNNRQQPSPYFSRNPSLRVRANSDEQQAQSGVERPYSSNEPISHNQWNTLPVNFHDGTRSRRDLANTSTVNEGRVEVDFVPPGLHLLTQRSQAHQNQNLHEGQGSNAPDRKRRHTGSEGSLRGGRGPIQSGSSGLRPSGGASSSVSGLRIAGTSIENAINLTAPSRPPPLRPTGGRRASDIVLPPWQPDAEAPSCTVCGTQFTLFNRRHHCRRCGKVVCASCSQHRITIPREFIVRDPSKSILPSPGILDIAGEEDSSPVDRNRYRNLGGGEEVRVCNPCVPDPNFSPPPQQPVPQLQREPAPYWPFPGYTSFASGTQVGPSQPQHGGRLRTMTDDSYRPPQIRPSISPNHRSSLSVGSRPHPASRTPLHSFTRNLPENPYQQPQRAILSTSLGQPSTFPSDPHSSSQHNFFPSIHRHPIPATPTQSEPQPQQRRQIAEEDECPICGEELPSKGPNGEETAREAHVEECIQSHFVGSSSHHQSSAAPAATVSASSVPSNESTPVQSTGGEPSRPRRHTATGRMLVYTATEKDCIGEECIICFEDFEVGQEMGRLPCWCKFHKHCIRAWWEKKGIGNCPTHQLPEEWTR